MFTELRFPDAGKRAAPNGCTVDGTCATIDGWGAFRGFAPPNVVPPPNDVLPPNIGTPFPALPGAPRGLK